MKRHPINEKPKSYKGLAWFIIVLIIVGFVVSVYLFGIGGLDEIIQP